MQQNKSFDLFFTLGLFCGIIILLLLLGCLFVYSSSSAYALHTRANAHYYLIRHLIGIFLGIIGACIIQLFHPRVLQKINRIIIIVCIGIVALTIVGPFAKQINGSFRWLSIAGFMFQPSELVKYSTILFVADTLSLCANKKKISCKNFISLLFLLSIVSYLLLRQPDFGLTVTLITTTLILFFIANYNIKILIGIVSSFIVSALVLIIIKPYRMKRIFSFLNPWRDPQGSGFQLIQSFTSFGLGHWLGDGIGYSKQKFFYLPMQHTDFIFSIIGEELGLIGTVSIVLLYIGFLYTGYRLARMTNDLFSFFTIVGYITLTILQTSINMCVATGLIPPKGVGLPFISYGNTALVCNLWMIGVIITIMRHSKDKAKNFYANTKPTFNTSYTKYK